MAGKNKQPRPDVDKQTAKGKGEGGFAPHPKDEGANDNGFQDRSLAKEQARQVTPAGKARSK
jgi:hypothetical protein